MSNSIDNRIVNMQFNNSQFENGIQRSIKSLDALKQGLKLEDSARSLSNLDKVGRNFNLSGIANGVTTVANRFTTLGIMGVTALMNITTAAMTAGVALVKSLTLDPIMSGFQEYETKMNSIKVMQANLGETTSLADIKKGLAELNDYADKTIYRFDQMTEAAGKFTAAGVDLPKTLKAVQGMANLAAGGGVDPGKLAGAYIQVSQALQQGYFMWIDYYSLVQAGLNSPELQKRFIATAKGMGKVVDESVPFKETLKDMWLTTDVFLKVMEQATDTTTSWGRRLTAAATEVSTLTALISTMRESVGSGWASTWETIFGDKEQATQFFTSINNGFSQMIKGSTDARNATMAYWNANGGRAAIIEALTSAFNGLKSVLKPIGQAFREIFPATTGDQLIMISRNIRDLFANFKIGEETSKNLKNTFKGLFALIDIGKQAASAFAKALAGVFVMFKPLTNIVLHMTGGIGNFIVMLDEAIKASDTFNQIWGKILKVMKPIADKLSAMTNAIVLAFEAVESPDLTGMDAFAQQVEKRFSPLKALVDFFKKLGTTFYNLARQLNDVFAKMRQNIINSFNSSNFNGIFDVINGTLIAGILLGIERFMNALTKLTNNVGGILKNVTEIFDGVRGCLEAWQNNLKANVILKIASALGILAAALFTISMIDSEKLTGALGALTTMFIDLFATMTLFAGIAGKAGILAMFAISTGMMGLALAVFVLAKALKQMDDVDWEQLKKGLWGIAGMSLILVVASKLMSKSAKGIITTAIGLVIFAGALFALSKVVEILGKLDTKVLTKGLISVGILLAEIGLFLRLTDFSGMGVLKGAGLLIMAGSLLVLAKAVEKLSSLNIKQLGKGLGSIAILLTELGLFINLTGKASNIITTAVALTIIGGAIYVLAMGIEKLGNLKPDQIGKGLFTLAFALGAIGLTLGMLSGKKIFLTSLAILDVAGSVMLLAQAMQEFAKMDWDQLTRALVGMGAGMAIIILAFTFIRDDIKDATAFFIMASAIYILGQALAVLGNLSLAQIGVGLLAIAGAFAVIGIAASLMTPIIPQLLALAGIMVLFGIAVALLGGGILALSAGIAALAASGVAGAAALTALVTSFIGLIPFMLQTLAKGLIDFCKVLADGAPVIATAFKTIITQMLSVIVTMLPQIIDAFMKLMITILQTIKTYLPQIIDLGADIIVKFLDGIAKNIGKVVSSAIDLVLAFIKAIVDKLPDVIQAGFDFVVSFINGVADAIRNNAPIMADAYLNLIDAMLTAFASIPKALYQHGVDAVKGFIAGLRGKTPEAVQAGRELGLKTKEATGNAIQAASPAKEFIKLGQYSVMGLVKGIKDNASLAATEAANMGYGTIDSLKSAISNMASLVTGDIDINPTIRPVLDLTDVMSGAKTIDSLMPSNPNITVTTANVQASSIATDMATVPSTIQNGNNLQKAMDDLSNALGKPLNMLLGGKVIVEGVTNEGQLVAVVEKQIMRGIDQGARRVPSGLTRLPSMA